MRGERRFLSVAIARAGGGRHATARRANSVLHAAVWPCQGHAPFLETWGCFEKMRVALRFGNAIAVLCSECT